MIEIGNIVKGKVKLIDKKYFWVELDEGYQAVTFINEIKANFVSKIEKYIEIGETYNFKVLSIDHNNKKGKLTMKGVPNIFAKNKDKILSDTLKPTKNGFDNLLKHAEEELKTWKK